LILPDGEHVGGLVQRGSGALLNELARVVREQHRSDTLWLLMVALTGAFPTADQVRKTRRALQLAVPETAFVSFVGACSELATRSENLDVEIDVVSNGVVVDVDFCATNSHNTGIQRVVRHTVSRWSVNRAPTLVAWTPRGGAMRTIDTVERNRVVAWGKKQQATTEVKSPPRVVVPFRSDVIIAEVPRYEICDPLAALAEFSGNSVAVVGYDAIPVVSADTVPTAETERYVRYLSVVKHARLVAGISRAATEEFGGFSRTLAAQGLPGPTTVEVPLPVDAPDVAFAKQTAAGTRPMVLCVGSQEPRKNHDAVLYAANVLWREGLDFSLRFIGGGSLWFTRGFDQRVRALAAAGRDILVLRGVDDSTMLEHYHQARFTMFPSLHEGYGLPVAESLALNTPVITTNYGSTAEIAEGGGCLLVDPRDDESMVRAMRDLLVDDALLARLQDQIARRPNRSWDEYARDLWSTLVREAEDALA
jgi:glycosyltransferase involved in cell wall biosynthesis